MTTTIKYGNGSSQLICNNCGTVIATGSKIPYNATIKGLNSLWFCCKECAEEYYKRTGKSQYL